MALEASADDFEEVFDNEHLTAEFLTLLGEYLENNRNTPEAKEMGRWLQDGKRLSGFTCRADVLPSLIQKLYERRIPFVLIQNVNGEYGLLIRIIDEDNAQQTIEDTLKAKARFIKMLSGKQFKEALVKQNTLDKSILYINGLSEEELTNLVDEMKDSYNGLSVGVEKRQDGSLSLLLHAKSVMKKQKEIKPITLLAVQNVIALNGMNSLDNLKKLSGKIKVSEMMLNNFADVNFGKDGFIYGGRNQYIKISKTLENDLIYESGFISIEERNATPHPTETKSVRGNEESLQSKINSMENMSYADNFEEVKQYFIAITPELYRINMGEKALAEQINTLVSDKLKSATIMKEEGRWSGKFQAYTREASDILDSFSKGKIPDGYTAQQMSMLQKTCSYYGLEPQEYGTAAAEIKNIETREDIARIELRDIPEVKQKEQIRSHDFSPVIANVDRDWGEER